MAEDDIPELINNTLEKVPILIMPFYYIYVYHIFTFPAFSVAYAMSTMGFLNLTGYQVLQLHLKHHHDCITVTTYVCRQVTRSGLTPGCTLQLSLNKLLCQQAQNCYCHLGLGQTLFVKPRSKFSHKLLISRIFHLPFLNPAYFPPLILMMVGLHTAAPHV